MTVDLLLNISKDIQVRECCLARHNCPYKSDNACKGLSCGLRLEVQSAIKEIAFLKSEIDKFNSNKSYDKTDNKTDSEILQVIKNQNESRNTPILKNLFKKHYEKKEIEDYRKKEEERIGKMQNRIGLYEKYVEVSYNINKYHKVRAGSDMIMIPVPPMGVQYEKVKYIIKLKVIQYQKNDGIAIYLDFLSVIKDDESEHLKKINNIKNPNEH